MSARSIRHSSTCCRIRGVCLRRPVAITSQGRKRPSEDTAMRALLVLIWMLLGGASALAADDIAAAQGVIRAQEQAFGRDDAAAAYSHAAPAIKQIFPAADIFLSMV